MTPLRHIMILASAGSGKTYALTNRFVDLLARGVPPDRIVALTFTRKAAGEFFDEILMKLARAARNEAAAAQLGADLGRTELTTKDFLRLLRVMISAMPRLRLGTLDSFFARIARVFPFELGLSGEFEVLEDYVGRLERQRVLRRIFTRAGELGTAQKEFIEAFKRATFGTEEKQLARRLDQLLDDHQERFLEAPDAQFWGEASRIWPQGNEWLEAKIDRVAAAAALNEWLRNSTINEAHRKRWYDFLNALTDWAPGHQPSDELKYILQKAIEAWTDLIGGRSLIKFNGKTQELSPAACRGLADLTRFVVSRELARHLEVTRGIHSLLRRYDAVYHESVRRAGKLTFGDIQRLLLPSTGGVLTGEAAGDGRLFIDYRLDAEIDHWLLDEFQDTSFGQWSVLKNLIDEAVQDTSGTRSFFCVGDVKQAIYAWREGDSRLFGEIYRHYNAASPGAVVAEHLDQSWRSGPAIIEMVNAVFGAAPVISHLFEGAAAKAWNDEWRPHVSAVPQRTGHTALVWTSKEESGWGQMLRILQEIRPLERGLTCAVLVQSNKRATEVADFLRREGGLPALAESDLHVCVDNPVGAALLALLQAAAHPGDTLAWEHVQMTPLGAVLRAEGIHTRDAATWRVLRQIHTEGFERTVEKWLRKLEGSWEPQDGFNRARSAQFAAAAARYDRTGSRRIAEFIQFMERHVVREPEGAAVVRVMTIHKSKGLGFDVVLLPDLKGNRLDIRRDGLAVQKSADRAVEWVLNLPPKLVYEADEVLARHVQAAEAEACQEALSLLYVAMTRAKRAMYLVIDAAHESKSRNYPKLLAEALGADARPTRIGQLEVQASWSSGNPEWHEAIIANPRPPSVDQNLQTIPGFEELRVTRREARRPSGETPGRVAAAQLFSLERTRGLEFGADVHALLAQVDWSSDDWAGWMEKWTTGGSSPTARQEALACLRSPHLRSMWDRRPGAEVWLERAFEIVIENSWVTGVFDRVVVERDRVGLPVAATVYDFKTDRFAEEDWRAMESAAERHAGQLRLYRQVAAALLGIDVRQVAAAIVFTQGPHLVPVSGS